MENIIGINKWKYDVKALFENIITPKGFNVCILCIFIYTFTLFFFSNSKKILYLAIGSFLLFFISTILIWFTNLKC